MIVCQRGPRDCEDLRCRSSRPHGSAEPFRTSEEVHQNLDEEKGRRNVGPSKSEEVH